MLDELFAAAYKVSVQLLPILGVVVLIFLLVLLKKLMTFMNALTASVNKVSGTIDGVDKSIEKMQVPLDTVVKISHTVDSVHEATYNGIKSAALFVMNNFETVKDYFTKGHEQGMNKAETAGEPVVKDIHEEKKEGNPHE